MSSPYPTLEKGPGGSYRNIDLGDPTARRPSNVIKLDPDRQQDGRSAQPAPLLDLLWLELTGKCNLTCIHCYADSSPHSPLYQTMREHDWQNVLLEGRSIGCRKAQFIGGEATLHPALPNLIAYARFLGYELVEVYTNGTRFTAELKRAFAEFRVSLAFSVYGADPETHDAVTQCKGSFKQTISNIAWSLESGLEVRVGIIQTPLNSDTIHQTRGFLTRLGVPSVAIDRQRAVGRGAMGCATQSPLSELCGNCGNGIVCVTPSGEVFPCIFARFHPIGKISESGLEQILRGRKLRSFRAMLPAPLQKPATSCNPDLLRGCPCSPDLLRGCKCPPNR